MCVFLVSLNGDDHTKQKISESDNIKDGLTTEGEGGLATKEAGDSHSGVTNKGSDSDDQQNVGENNDSHSEGKGRNIKRY